MVETEGIIAQLARIREAANLFIEKELRQRGLKGVVPAHGAVLRFLLRQSEPVPLKAVVQGVGRVKSTVTVTVATLEKHGYLQKQPCDQDSRVVKVALSAKGKALRQDFAAISDRLLAKVYGDLPQTDREQLVKLLDRIERHLAG